MYLHLQGLRGLGATLYELYAERAILQSQLPAIQMRNCSGDEWQFCEQQKQTEYNTKVARIAAIDAEIASQQAAQAAQSAPAPPPATSSVAMPSVAQPSVSPSPTALTTAGSAAPPLSPQELDVATYAGGAQLLPGAVGPDGAPAKSNVGLWALVAAVAAVALGS